MPGLLIVKLNFSQDPGALEKYKTFVNPDNRLGDDTIGQKMKDDWKGFTCSKEVCDELNRNGDIIQNINAFDDLNQFFLQVLKYST